MELFVSYAHQDMAKVRALVDVLRRAGHQPWFDEQLQIGREWQPQLEAAIQRCDAFVYALTPLSLDSEWCQWEFVTAIQHGKPIVPILLEDFSARKLPVVLQRFQYVDAHDGFPPALIARLERDFAVLSVTIPVDQAPPAPEQPVGEPSRAPTVQQTVTIKDTRDSTINVVGSQTIGTQFVGARPRSWTLPVIIGLLLILIMAVAVVLTAFPEAQRSHILYQIGLIAPSAMPTATPLAGEPAAAGEFLVVVARFARTSGTQSEPSINVVEVLQRAADQIDNARVIELSQPIADNAEAVQVRDLYGASLVVYGRVDAGGVQAHYKGQETSEIPVEDDPRISADTVENFDAYIFNGIDADYFFWVTVGQFHFYNGDCAAAVNALDRAEARLTDARVEPETSALYYYRGLCHSLQGDIVRGTQDLYQAVDFTPEGQFDILPVDRQAIRFVQYYGTTVAGYHGRLQNPDGYLYSQGLNGGLDFFVERSTLVRAGVYGMFVGMRPLAGNSGYAQVAVGDRRVLYMHISAPAALTPGEQITPDTILGTAGVVRPHLHVEVRFHRVILNPLRMMPETLRDSLLVDFPPERTGGFFPGDRWQDALDQPALVIRGPVLNAPDLTDAG
jgi:murein DD-endopeptidase MepM/ murein hydrolase activator NlpD